MGKLRQRTPREVNPAFLAFLRRQRCRSCGCPPPVQAAHIRMASPERGKESPGIGAKPDDKWAVPLCAACHLDDPDSQHRVGEEKFWGQRRTDPFKVAEGLYAEFCKQVSASNGAVCRGKLGQARVRYGAPKERTGKRPKPYKTRMRERRAERARSKPDSRKGGLKTTGFKLRQKRKWPKRKIQSRPFERRAP